MIRFPMPFSRLFLLMAAATLFSAPAFSQTPTETAARPQTQTWAASGTLLESCTCAVPCTCNFGEGPSPHAYCHAIFAYRLEKASWNGTDLSGLIIGGADGPKGIIGFLDERATPEQRPFLEKIARMILAQGGPVRGARRFIRVPITHTVQGNNLKLDIPGHGGFTASVIIGRDGKTPVVVENNTVWPIPRAIKGKAKPLAYSDSIAGQFRGDGSNANYGKFTMSGPTGDGLQAKTIPSAKTIKTTQLAKKEKTLPACCEVRKDKK